MLDRRLFLSSALTLAAWPAAAGTDPVAAAIRSAQARADRLLRRQGLVRGTVAERLGALIRDERWLYPDDEAGRDRAVADMNARLAALRPSLGIAFGDLPIPGAEVRRMAPADVAAGKAGYRTAEAYYVDLRAIRSRPSWTLPSVAFHEVVPGHLLHLSLDAQANQTPFFEGWAVYAERLAVDLGAYAADPRGELGFLHWRLFRLARAVADRGLNMHSWSRDRAITEMHAIQGPSIAFVTVEADAERIATRPGQAALEAGVMLAIEGKRPRHRADWPAWHAKLLREPSSCCSAG